MNSNDWYTKNRFYMASYAADDLRARQDCEAVLVFGEPTRSKSGYVPGCPFDWKWVDLPCPSCRFVHGFKRVAWVDEWPLGILTEEDRTFLLEAVRPKGKKVNQMETEKDSTCDACHENFEDVGLVLCPRHEDLIADDILRWGQPPSVAAQCGEEEDG